MEFLHQQLLVATPELPDSNFFRTVVLMAHHDEEGAFGFVLNRPAGMSLKKIWASFTEGDCPVDRPIHVGGPVESPLLAIHENPDASENEVMEGVYICSEKESLEQLISDPRGRFKVFTGYSGWGPGQLESELEVGSWFTTPARPDDIFSDDEDLWDQVAARIGNQILFSKRDPDFLQADPSLN